VTEQQPPIYIYALTYSDGYDSGPITMSLHSTRALAEKALEDTVASVSKRRRTGCEKALWWMAFHHQALDEAWVEKEVAEATERSRREHGIERFVLDKQEDSYED
jgi:hypothetical protein